ncbi:MAG: ATP-binding protein [Desulfobacteraceae bacterium]|nr:ATP-binding protein [Desulfobacteraceae bacterium]
MILSYGMKNFSSFKEGVVVSFELKTNSAKKIEGGDIASHILCVNGANASGKTNLLKGLSFLGDFCSNSFSYKPEEKIAFDSYFYSEEPTDFFVDFVIDDIKYRYECSITSKKVLSEKIFRNVKKKSLLIEREENRLKFCVKEFQEIYNIKKLRTNASIISIANQHEISEIMPIYNFFDLIMSNVTYSGLSTKSLQSKANENNVSRFYKENDAIFTFVKDIIRKSDLGISDINIKSHKDPNDKEIFYPIFYHKNNKVNFPLLFINESSGTKSLYLTLYRYWLVIEFGGLLVLDEFDLNLHPHLLPMLLKFFTNSKVNKKDAQMIFTTHNIETLKSMGKYRTFFVNKNDNECFGYRLDEIPGDLLRNDRDITPIYNSGKIGGVPRL